MIVIIIMRLFKSGTVNAIVSALFVLTLLGSSCDSYTPYPRKMGFPRIDFPGEKTYESFQNETCPFTFQYPSDGVITRNLPDSCWVDINYPAYDCKWHISYRDVGKSGKNRNVHYEEYRKLIYNHTIKASQIKESPIEVPAGRGVLFEVYGNVGTPAQVFLYDSTENHIMMMSFYFQTALKNDSLAPVIDYMKGEVRNMLDSFSWEKE